ncbi:MAG: hypothetical protein ACI84O_001115 [Myxococcota bacterium]
MSLSPETNSSNDEYKEGWIEINKLISQGKSWSGNEPNCMFVNLGDSTFADASAISGLDFKDDGRSAVAHDIDFDGDLDLIITNRTAPRLRIMRNKLESENGYLQLKLIGKANSDAIGARIEVHLNDSEQTILSQTRRAGSGYQSQASAWLHFGLGQNSVSKIVVKWPDGSQQDFRGDNLNAETSRQRYVATQSQELLTVDARHSTEEVIEVASTLSTDKFDAPQQTFARIVLPYAIPMPRLTMIKSDNESVSLFGTGRTAALATPQSKAILINLWSETCAPCIGELSGIMAHQQQFIDFNVMPIALNVSSSQTPPNWTAPSAQATDACLTILDVMQRTLMRRDIAMPTPSSFLIDARGNLVAFYLGVVDIEVLVEDFKLLNMLDEQRLEAALPFAGRWLNDVPKPSLLPLEFAFNQRELVETAREFQTGFIYLQTARALVESQRLELSIEYFEEAIATGPYVFEAFSGLGYAKHLIKDYAGAIAAYETALSLQPDDKSVASNLQKAREALGD